jgi:hypothetical protein
MTFLSKAGTFNSPTTTGNHSVTGIGFKPVALIMWTTGQYANTPGELTTSLFSLGFAAGTTGSYTNGYIAESGQTAVTTSVEARRYSMSAAIGTLLYNQTVTNEASLYSFDNDGFTLNWTTNGGSSLAINYLALGGDDIISAKVINWQNRSGTGSQSITTVGFKPDLVVHAGIETSGTSPITSTSSSFQIGTMDSSGNQWATYNFATTGVNPSVTGRIQVTDGCIIGTGRTTSVDHKAAFTSMDTNGFTLTWSS